MLKCSSAHTLSCLYRNCSFANIGHADMICSTVLSNRLQSPNLLSVSVCNIFVAWYLVCNDLSSSAIFLFHFLISDLSLTATGNVSSSLISCLSILPIYFPYITSLSQFFKGSLTLLCVTFLIWLVQLFFNLYCCFNGWIRICLIASCFNSIYNLVFCILCVQIFCNVDYVCFGCRVLFNTSVPPSFLFTYSLSTSLVGWWIPYTLSLLLLLPLSLSLLWGYLRLYTWSKPCF